MLHTIAIISLSAGVFCALFIIMDLSFGDRQPMMVIMLFTGYRRYMRPAGFNISLLRR